MANKTDQSLALILLYLIFKSEEHMVKRISKTVKGWGGLVLQTTLSECWWSDPPGCWLGSLSAIAWKERYISSVYSGDSSQVFNTFHTLWFNNHISGLSYGCLCPVWFGTRVVAGLLSPSPYPLPHLRQSLSSSCLLSSGVTLLIFLKHWVSEWLFACVSSSFQVAVLFSL